VTRSSGRPCWAGGRSAAWATLGIRTLKDSFDDRVPKLAAEVAFFALLAMPPALLAVLGSVGFLAGALGPEITSAVEEQILAAARTFLTPSTVQEVMEPVVSTLLEEGRADVVSVGILLALWSASRATSAVVDTMRIAYDLETFRPGWKRRLVALSLTVGLALAVIVLMPALVAGPRWGVRLVQPLGVGDVIETAWRILYWPVVTVLGIVLLATFYQLALPRRTPWRREVPGAVLAVIVWVVGSLLVRLYAQWTLESGSTYGSLSAPLVLLLWLYVVGLAVLLGAELNSEIEKLWPSGRQPGGLEPSPQPQS